MKNYFTIISLILALKVSANCVERTPTELKAMVNTVIHAHFPDLDPEKVELGTFHEEGYFLQSQPKVKSMLLFRNRVNRRYVIEVNPKFYHCGPEDGALEAILAHELTHINDYRHRSVFQIMKMASMYLSDNFKRKKRALYERATDRHVVKMGLGDGLIAYRNWVYKKLTPEQLKEKNEFYLSPQEIRKQQETIFGNGDSDKSHGLSESF